MASPDRFNVYANEVETHIDRIDWVEASAIVGVPHLDFGEAVTAVVAREPDRDDVTGETIIRRLSAYDADGTSKEDGENRPREPLRRAQCPWICGQGQRLPHNPTGSTQTTESVN